ncbi:MAG: helix-turn-helix transcriptional regulator [Novosphingobium sp.]|nr:helix-turn-helix transcriptional regulator [Novosphingobium sp.]
MQINKHQLQTVREGCALTQEGLAHKARVSVRTVQRAESGLPIRPETLADIAAVLGVSPQSLIEHAFAEDGVGPDSDSQIAADGRGQLLKRTESAEYVVTLLERSTMACLQCQCEPSDDNIEALRSTVGAIEGLMRDPWDDQAPPPLRFKSQIDRLDALVLLAGSLQQLKSAGLALYAAASSELVKVPSDDDLGMRVRADQQPEHICAARFMIARDSGERVRSCVDVTWPLAPEQDPALHPSAGAE